MSCQSQSIDNIMFDESCVRDVFKGVNSQKACGPDKLKGRLIKTCAEQIAPIFTFIFNLSLKEHKIPSAWKTSKIIPVPKKSKVTCMNDLRPVALTPVIFKCLLLCHSSSWRKELH